MFKNFYDLRNKNKVRLMQNFKNEHKIIITFLEELKLEVIIHFIT